MLWLVKGLGPGGAERLLVSAAAAHDRRAFSFTADYLLPWKDALVPELEALGVPTHCLEVRDERDPRWAARLRRQLVTEPVDVLHVHNPYPAGVARLVVRTLPRRIRPKLVYTVHNTWTSFRPPTRWLNGLTQWLDDYDIVVSDRVVATMWPWYRSRSEVVVHGIVPAAVERARGSRERMRASLGIDPDDVVAVTIANFRAQKDYPNLFAAARRLAECRSRLRIVAVGQGPLEGEMRALLASMDLGDRVLLLGQRDDALDVLAAADMFVLASNNEGLPVAVMEAMAMGLPVVATDVGGLREAVTDGVEGLLVAPRDPDALAGALDALARDAGRRREMADAARQRSRDFDIANAVHRIEEIYRKVLSR